MDNLVKLKNFNTIEEANSAVELLEKNNIFLKLEKEELSEDSTFAGNTLLAQICIKVKPEELETAQNLISELEEVNIDKLEPDYYLFEFTDEELIDMLKKPDEWSLNDFHWAQEILKQRGKEPEKAQIEIWKKERLKFLSQPEDVTSRHINTAYFFCVLGGIIGIVMGRHINSFKKTLPNGQKVYNYTDESRKKGLSIALFGTVCLIAEVVLILIFLAI
jgi:hypothetical protein